MENTDIGLTRRKEDLPPYIAYASNIPVPDPSDKTTQQVRREILGLRELMEEKLKGTEEEGESSRKILETRLDGMDKAIELLQGTADKFPGRIDEKIRALREVSEGALDAVVGTHIEKFNSIQTQFRERDVRTEQSSKDSKVAVDAALQAAKEAVGEQNKSSALAIAKSEAATTKQIDGQGAQMQNMIKATDDKFTDLKERMTRIEGSGAGKAQVWMAVAIIVSIVISLNVFFGLRGSDKPAAVTTAPQVIYVPAPAQTTAPVAPPVPPR